MALTVLIGGGFGSLFAAVSGISGRDGALLRIAAAFACLFASALTGAGSGAAFFATVGAGSPFAAGFVAVFASVESAGVSGMIDAILSFSTSTYPKSVFTLNMLSSYATITPCSFFPSFRRISSARAAHRVPKQTNAASPKITRMRLAVCMPPVCAAASTPARLTKPQLSGPPPPVA